MTPTEETHLIALWNAGMETAAIAQSLGIKAATAQSRAYRLQFRGVIQPSTTVVAMRLRAQSVLHDACSGNTWRRPDAGGATATTARRGRRSAVPPGPRAREAGESPGRSAGLQAPPGFEPGQAVPRLRGREAFFKASTAIAPARGTVRSA